MTEPSTPRSPWAASALSLLCTGLGHLYCGRVVRGLTLFCASLLFGPLALVLALLTPSTPLLVVLILAGLGIVALYLFAAVDAWRLARATGSFAPRDYNHPLVYVLLGVVGVVYPVLTLAYLRGHVFEAFYIPTASMVPTVLDGDRVLVNKLVLANALPERGDVVVFKAPERPGLNWIKRVIGVPGDRVAVVAGDVFVNGTKLARTPAVAGPQVRGVVFAEELAGRRYLVQMGGGTEKAKDYAEQVVPAGCYFLLGDNRDNSLDSRDLGCIARGDILGAVPYVYLPAETWSRFGVLRP